MVAVRVTNNARVFGDDPRNVYEGDMLELDAGEAAALIASGNAEAVEAPVEAPGGAEEGGVASQPSEASPEAPSAAPEAPEPSAPVNPSPVAEPEAAADGDGA